MIVIPKYVEGNNDSLQLNFMTLMYTSMQTLKNKPSLQTTFGHGYVNYCKKLIFNVSDCYYFF